MAPIRITFFSPDSSLSCSKPQNRECLLLRVVERCFPVNGEQGSQWAETSGKLRCAAEHSTAAPSNLGTVSLHCIF